MRQFVNPPTLHVPEGTRQSPGDLVYTQVVRVGNMVFVAGQCANDEQFKTVGIGDPWVQARRCYENVRRALEGVGASMKDVVKVTTYSTLEEYRKILIDVRPEFFEPPLPASTGVVVSALAKPEWLFEVEAIAVIGDGD
jgi:2-iminobutanoate/2-iminopropanoate deaminase